jgi:pilus assembly protein CpaF
MRPSRIIVGEVRGSEAIDMLQSLNTGHCGASSGHSNSPEDMLSRIETMVLMGMEIPISAIRRQMAAGIDIIIHLGRLRDKSRKLLKIVEVLGCEDEEIKLQTLFEFREREVVDGRIQGEWVKVHDIQKKEKLLAAGYSEARIL